MMRFSLALVAAVFIVGCGSKSKKGQDAGATGAQKTEATSTTEATKAPKTTSTEGKVTCTMKSDTRHIHVKKNGGGCELAYNKFGNEEVIATSMSGTEHCQKIADRIKGNLESAGFKCE